MAEVPVKYHAASLHIPMREQKRLAPAFRLASA